MRDWKSWQRFLNDVDRARRELKFQPGEDCLYRGVSDIGHTLTPSLYRPGNLSVDQYWQLESDLFFEFQARSRELREYRSDWDVLFHMRHHGVPTRLLDWSELMGVALAFAVSGYDPASKITPCLWLLNPWALNKKSWGIRDLVAPRYLGWDSDKWEYDEFGEMLTSYDEMPWKLPVAIYPVQSNLRMAAQRGLFTIHGNDVRPLEKTLKSCVRQVPMSAPVVAVAREILTIMGFDQYTLFPDSDGLARALGEKYRLAGRPEDRVSGQRAHGSEENAVPKPGLNRTKQKRRRRG